MRDISSDFVQNVQQTIQRYHMLRGGDVVLVGFSGGPDSVCLLDVLETIGKQYRLRLCVAHFNHKLRGQASEEDALFAQEFARRRK